MALKLTDSRSSILEPYKKNRFIFQIENGGDGANNDAWSKLAFVCHTVTVPTLAYGEIAMNRLNDTFFAAGKVQFTELNASFYDYIVGADSAGQIMYNWGASIYDLTTGTSSYKAEYTRNAVVAQLDPKGSVARLWNIFYMWPKNVTFGESLTAADDAVCEVTASFRFDYAIKTPDSALPSTLTALGANLTGI